MRYLEHLSHDTAVIPYRPEISRALGGNITAAILLQQICYRFAGQGGEFYKFRKPCDHKACIDRPEDTWTEELAMSPKQFDTALKKIAVKLTKAQWQSGDMKHDMPVEFRKDRENMTWYRVNEDNLDKLLLPTCTGNSRIAERVIPELPKGEFPNCRKGNSPRDKEELQENTGQRRDKSKTKAKQSGACGTDGLFVGVGEQGFTGNIPELTARVKAIALAEVKGDPGETEAAFEPAIEYVLDGQWRYYKIRGKDDPEVNVYDELLAYLRRRYENPESNYIRTDRDAQEVRWYIQEEFGTHMVDNLPQPAGSKAQTAERNAIGALYLAVGGDAVGLRQYLRWLHTEMEDWDNRDIRPPVTMKKVLREENLATYGEHMF